MHLQYFPIGNTEIQSNPVGQKMHVIEWGVCSWQTVLYTWLNLNRRLNFVLCSGKICVSRLLWRAHMIGAGEEDYLAALQTHSDTIDRKAYFELAPRFQCFDLSSIETRIVGHTHWGSKTLVETEGIFNFWLVRNSGHGSRIFIWYPVYTGWKYPEWIFRTWFSFLDAHTCPFGA